MKHSSFKAACVFLLFSLSLTGCGSDLKKDDSTAQMSSVTETLQNTTAATTTAATTTTAAATTTASTTTSAETTSTAVTTTTELTTILTTTTTEDVTMPVRDTEDTSPPFGDLSGAYVCVGGTAIYPSVYVLTKEEVDHLADDFNSRLWTEIPKDKYVGPTPGPSDIEFYFYKDGVFSELDQFGSLYIDENGNKHYYRETPMEGHDLSENASLFSLIYYVKDPSRLVSTHLADRFIEPIRPYTVQESWELVWDYVLPFIQENDA